MSDLPSAAQVVRTTLVVSTFCIASLAAQEPARPPVVGRWDLTVSGGEGRHLPSWLEVHWSGDRVLVGQFVGVVGSVRPISRLDFAHDTLRWSLPPQWEGGNGDFQFTGVFAGDSLAGSLTTSDGRRRSSIRAWYSGARRGGSSTRAISPVGMWWVARISGRRSPAFSRIRSAAAIS